VLVAEKATVTPLGTPGLLEIRTEVSRILCSIFAMCYTFPELTVFGAVIQRLWVWQNVDRSAMMNHPIAHNSQRPRNEIANCIGMSMDLSATAPVSLDTSPLVVCF
jgi:hypothetical protein